MQGKAEYCFVHLYSLHHLSCGTLQLFLTAHHFDDANFGFCDRHFALIQFPSANTIRTALPLQTTPHATRISDAAPALAESQHERRSRIGEDSSLFRCYIAGKAWHRPNTQIPHRTSRPILGSKSNRQQPGAIPRWLWERPSPTPARRNMETSTNG